MQHFFGNGVLQILFTFKKLCMKKYLQELVDDLTSLKRGLEMNVAKWAGLPVNADQLQAAIDALTIKDAQIAEAENKIAMLRTEARDLVEKNKKLARQAENLALGIHQNEQELLNGYGISQPKNPTTVPVPAKAVIASIVDDFDGQGFIVTMQSLSNAESYEVEKGVGTQSDILVLAPPYPHYQTFRKLNFTDDDVKRGVRYFYRVRGFNRNGYCEWSEPVSRVQ